MVRHEHRQHLGRPRGADLHTRYTHAYLECLIVDSEDVCVLIGIKVAKRAHAPGERVQGVGGL